MNAALQEFLEQLKERDTDQPEFHQAVEEVLSSVWPLIENDPRYRNGGLLERLVEPERVLMFRVSWVDDSGQVQVNRGYRVQMSSAIGPYKGGLRFHPSVDLGVLKFLAFEQTFKNALTTLPLGSAKGGADFDPKGKSEGEVMRFCQSFMTELYRHIGADLDVPAGDIGVGGREVGYLFGMYKKLANNFTGVFTGKGYHFGGSLIRPEATGYGLIYFVEEMLGHVGMRLDGRRVAISGAGNVAQYAMQKAIEQDATVITISDSGGTVYNPDGFTVEHWHYLHELKNKRRGRVHEFAEKFGLEYSEGGQPWQYPCDIALPCATQNELDEEDAQTLLNGGCQLVAEGANMPCTPGAVERFQQARIQYAPGKASNAGGVACSGLEMTQNSLRMHWTAGEVDEKLHFIMNSIHHACEHHGRGEDGYIDYMRGANIAGFIKVAEAMLDQGVV